MRVDWRSSAGLSPRERGNLDDAAVLVARTAGPDEGNGLRRTLDRVLAWRDAGRPVMLDEAPDEGRVVRFPVGGRGGPER